MLFRFLLLTIIFSSNTMNAQILDDYQWQNRIVLIISNDENAAKYQEQLAIFQSNTEGLDDRKLLIGKVMPKRYSLGLENLDWIDSTELYREFSAKKTDFEVILIGLDGGVKLRQAEVLSLEKLFSTIDVMPMRRAELKRKKQH